MNYQIEHLTAKDHDELLQLLNTVFRKTGDRTFDISLPAMWERDDEHMSKHIAIRVDGKIVAVTGIYPLPTVIAGQPILFGTIGNVATLPEYEGRGMMRCLFTAAVEEAKRMGMEVARLGGLRQRYNRYGFENCGTDYEFKLRPKNVADFYRGDADTRLSGAAEFTPYITFRRIGMEDTELLQFVMDLQKSADMYVDRGDMRRFFKTLSSYNSQIQVAFGRDGEPIGYVVATANGASISEHRARSAAEEYQMICEWLLFSGVEELVFHTAPWECELNRLMSKICEKWSIIDTSHFNPFKWGKLLDSLLKVKAKYSVIPKGSLVVEIEGEGTFAFRGDSCTETDEAPQLTLSHLDAARFFLGDLPIASVNGILTDAALPEESRLYAQSVFPLPLWWCNQDRV